jgi:hypothetical protein
VTSPGNPKRKPNESVNCLAVKMAIKLYIYMASKANVAVILRRSGNKNEWEMIRWDLDTDTFTEGQWLMKKVVNAKTASISPCGRYFAYAYDVYGFIKGEKQKHESHAVVSQVPNFTALYHTGNFGGGWGTLKFSRTGEVYCCSFVNKGMEKVGDVDLPFTLDEPDTKGGPVDVLMDPKGRVITTNGGQLFADDVLLYDTTAHQFTPRSPVKTDSESSPDVSPSKWNPQSTSSSSSGFTSWFGFVRHFGY